MKKKVSLKDIAKEAGVSTALVSYVLSGKEKKARVGQEIAAVIRKIAEELNYQPNHIAKSLKTGKSYTIGLIVADISNQFFANIARHIEDEAKGDNYTAIFGSSDEKPDKLRDLLDVLIKRQVDGFIIAPTEHSEAHIQYINSLNIPFVLIDRYFQEIETNHVSIDNHQASYQATKHLIHNGCKHIVMIAYKNELIHMQNRIKGFSDAMADHGLAMTTNSIVRVEFKGLRQDLEQYLDRLLDGKQPVDAILFATNTLSTNGLRYLNNRNYRIPEDLAVVCFDESEAFDFFYSPITHVKQPLTDIAKRAVRILIDEIEGNNETLQQIEFASELVVRKSCGS